MKRYPLRPLVDFTGAESNSELARILGVQRRSIFRYASSGLPREKAEEYADRVAAHPYELWNEMRDDVLEELSRDCLECGDPFVPTRRGHVYCSYNCKQRRNRRRYYYEYDEPAMRRERYATDPAYREREKARRRKHYAECADYERADAKRRYERRKATK